MTDSPTRHYLDMACTGHGDGGIRQAEIDARYERAKARLSRGSKETLPFNLDDASPDSARTFLDALLWSLLLDHRASVTGFPGDQWWGVEVRFYPTDTFTDPETVFIECDSPLDGLVTIWEWLEERQQPDLCTPSSSKDTLDT